MTSTFLKQRREAQIRQTFNPWLMIPYLVHPFQEIKGTQKNQQWLNTERAVSVPEEAVTTLRAASRRLSHYNREKRSRCFGRPEAGAVHRGHLAKGRGQAHVQ